MSTAKQLAAAGSLVLPLLVGTGGTALADGGPASELIQDQSAQSSVVQNNINVSPVNQVNAGGKGDQAAQTWTNQSNVNDTEHDQSEEQDDA
ncbi:hypothetical protein [Saccharopolyspora taberi]|uniref:Secreted protein n=1 Tax=Saccharopolyspora taberi TaxID=60895 RepID=A0ABN3VFR7_9PSEU